MQLYQRTRSGDRVLAPGTAVSGKPENDGNATDCPVSFVQRTIPVSDAPEVEVDFVALERAARAARSAWIGSKLQSFYQALVRKFERAGSAELENYLAASKSLAELEERIRRYERMQPLHH